MKARMNGANAECGELTSDEWNACKWSGRRRTHVNEGGARENECRMGRREDRVLEETLGVTVRNGNHGQRYETVVHRVDELWLCFGEGTERGRIGEGLWRRTVALQRIEGTAEMWKIKTGVSETKRNEGMKEMKESRMNERDGVQYGDE